MTAPRLSGARGSRWRRRGWTRALIPLAGAAAIVLALAPAPAPALGAQAPSWHLEQVLPPQLPGESNEEHAHRFPIGLGKVGDIAFWAPNKGVLITAGDPPTIPPGVWAYNGSGWYQLATVCGASDGRIAWAGADDFWTVSDGRAGQSGDERPPPLEDNTLCHFKAEGENPLEVVASYASLAFQANSYQAMHAAACLSPSDCWFGGELLPEAEPGVKGAFGAFQLHWNGTSVNEEPYPAEHVIEGLRKFGSYLYESVRLSQEDHLLESESPAAPPDLHAITPAGVQPTFVSLTTGFPRYAPGERPYALSFPLLASDEEALWAAASPLTPAPPESAAGEVTVIRYAGGEWSQVLGYGTDPAEGNPFTQPARAERENETVSSLAAEPGSEDAWLALTSLDNQFGERAGAAPAFVARVSSRGEVSERQALPAASEGVGAKGTAHLIACPAKNDCWMVTSKGWLFHYSDEAERTLPSNGDGAFAHLITARPADEGVPQVQPDAPPVDDSGLLGEAPPPPPIERPHPEELRVPVAVLSSVHQRLVHGTTLELRFHLAVRARVQLIAKRRGRVVARTRRMTLAAGNHRLLLVLNRRQWPTKLSLETHALAPVPTVSTQGAGNDNVSTGLTVLPRTPSFARAEALP